MANPAGEDLERYLKQLTGDTHATLAGLGVDDVIVEVLLEKLVFTARSAGRIEALSLVGEKARTVGPFRALPAAVEAFEMMANAEEIIHDVGRGAL